MFLKSQNQKYLMIINQVLFDDELEKIYIRVARAVVGDLRQQFAKVVLLPDYYIPEKAQSIDPEILIAIVDALAVDVLLVINHSSADNNRLHKEWFQLLSHPRVTVLYLSISHTYTTVTMNGILLSLPNLVVDYLECGLILTVSKLRHSYPTATLLHSLTTTSLSDIDIYTAFHTKIFCFLDGIVEFPYSHEFGDNFSKIYESYFVKQYRGLFVFGESLLGEFVRCELLGDSYDHQLRKIFEQLHLAPLSVNMFIRRAHWMSIKAM